MHAPRITELTLITDTTPCGLKVAGAALRYDGTLATEPHRVDPSAFRVRVDLDATRKAVELPLWQRDGQAGGALHERLSTAMGAEVRGERTAVRAYTAAEPAIGAPAVGPYVILEFDTEEPLAQATYFSGFTSYFELAGGYSVTQVADVLAAPARPEESVPSSTVIHPVVDRFAHDVLTRGLTQPYRLFTPEVRDGVRYPLVVAMHGHGESGDDNYSQVAGNQTATAWAEPARQQRHPAFVLAPQAPRENVLTGGWWRPERREVILELISHVLRENPAIDADRVYLTGPSMGSFGSWGLLTMRPDMFAGALLECGAVTDVDATVAATASIPVWAVHSEDDSVVKYEMPGSDVEVFRAYEAAGLPVVWAEWDGRAPVEEQEKAARDAVRRAEAVGARHLFTTFPSGTTPMFDHGSWIPVYRNDVMLQWLLAQRRTLSA